jgi:chorismate mutase / prephenate dehydratase
MELRDIRREIDEIDAELARLFERRMGLSCRVAAYKREQGLPVLDAAREQEVLRSAEAAISHEGLRPFARRFFEDIMALSRQYQLSTMAPAETAPSFSGGRSVAYLGPEGSFSHEAFLQAFGPDAKAMPVASFEDIVGRVASGACGRGLLPVENSLTGGVFAAADLLTAGNLHIIGETVLPVRHCLLGIPGAVLGDIRTVLSHTQPLEQCRQYLRRRGVETKTCASTTGAAREVAQMQDITLAAIGSEAAGRIYGLNLLEHDIQDNPANYTRFVVVSAADEEIPGANKISAIFVVEHRPGTLYGLLRAFADGGVNILNLVSRPVPGSPWQYCFHMDFDGNLKDTNVQAALKAAGENCRSILILGNYKKWEGA